MSASNRRRSAAVVRSLVCALTALALMTASCVSTHHVPATMTPSGQAASWRVRPGDKVRVTMNDGWIGAFTVRSVTSDAIVANDGMRFEHAHIKLVERRSVSTGKTVLLVGGIALGVLLVLGLQGLSPAAFQGSGGGGPNFDR